MIVVYVKQEMLQIRKTDVQSFVNFIIVAPMLVIRNREVLYSIYIWMIPTARNALSGKCRED